MTVIVYALSANEDQTTYLGTDKQLARLKAGSSPEEIAQLEQFNKLLKAHKWEELSYPMKAYLTKDEIAVERQCARYTTEWKCQLLARACSLEVEKVENMRSQLRELLWQELEYITNPNPFYLIPSSMKKEKSSEAT